MDIPDGVEAAPDQVCKLNKSIYGLKQSPRCWYEKFDEFLIQIGFIRSKLYTKFDSNYFIYLLVYVDDVLICGNNINKIEKLKQHLNSTFEMSDCGPLQYYLGTKIEYDRINGVMKLSQHTNIEEIFNE